MLGGDGEAIEERQEYIKNPYLQSNQYAAFLSRLFQQYDPVPDNDSAEIISRLAILGISNVSKALIKLIYIYEKHQKDLLPGQVLSAITNVQADNSTFRDIFTALEAISISLGKGNNLVDTLTLLITPEN